VLHLQRTAKEKSGVDNNGQQKRKRPSRQQSDSKEKKESGRHTSSDQRGVTSEVFTKYLNSIQLEILQVLRADLPQV
jgi:hypothetical protein